MDAAYTGKQIAERRKAKGLTQKALAEALHVTDKAVSKWERGINFPDLGLIEKLAEELETTPAVLLCLEEAPNEAAINSVVQLSAQQAEEARRDVRYIGWAAVALAVLLLLSGALYGRSVQHTQYAYYMLYTAAAITVLGAQYIFRAYGLIMPVEAFDLIPSAMVIFSLMALFFTQWLTGSNPSPLWLYLLILTISTGAQLLFCRLLVQPLAKRIPLILTVLYALWHLMDGEIYPEEWLPAVGCAVMYFAYFIWKKLKSNEIPS